MPQEEWPKNLLHLLEAGQLPPPPPHPPRSNVTVRWWNRGSMTLCTSWAKTELNLGWTQNSTEPGLDTQNRTEPGLNTQNRTEPGLNTQNRTEPGLDTQNSTEPGLKVD